MKTIYPFLAAFALAFLWSTNAQAQVCAGETWPVTVTGAQCTVSNQGRLDFNRDLCRLYDLAAGETDASQCPQAQLCGFSSPTQPACAGGALCSAAQARACNRFLYPDTTAGRTAWGEREVIVRELRAIKDRHAPPPQQGSDYRVWCINFWLPANAATRNQRCAEGLLPQPCNICRDVLDF